LQKEKAAQGLARSRIAHRSYTIKAGIFCTFHPPHRRHAPAKLGCCAEAVRARLAFMPLRKPTVVDRELMETLLLHSRSLIGQMFRLLERAAIAALDREECLSAALIEAVALRRRRDEDG